MGRNSFCTRGLPLFRLQTLERYFGILVLVLIAISGIKPRAPDLGEALRSGFRVVSGSVSWVENGSHVMHAHTSFHTSAGTQNALFVFSSQYPLTLSPTGFSGQSRNPKPLNHEPTQ